MALRRQSQAVAFKKKTDEAVVSGRKAEMKKPLKSATEILQRAGIVTTRQRVGLLDMLLSRTDHPDAERLAHGLSVPAALARFYG